jgi:hypothetical protein
VNAACNACEYDSPCPLYPKGTCSANMVFSPNCEMINGQPCVCGLNCPAGYVANDDCTDCETRDPCPGLTNANCTSDQMLDTDTCKCVYKNCPDTAPCETGKVLNENTCKCEFDSPCPDYPKDTCLGTMVFSPNCDFINDKPCVCGLHCPDGQVADATCDHCE